MSSLIDRLKEEDAFDGVTVDCPDCECIYDEQFTCTTCWNQGGNGKISVEEIIDDLIKDKK